VALGDGSSLLPLSPQANAATSSVDANDASKSALGLSSGFVGKL
jgi:hypothetical protein